MEINDLMQSLTKIGVSKLTLTLNEQREPMAVADQAVNSTKGVTLFQHQCTGGSFEDALNELSRRTKNAAGIHGRFNLEIVDPS